jgi:4-hydroxybenzoate polyprenyltransferase
MDAFIQLIRPSQWVKNLFVASPLLVTPAKVSSGNLLVVVMGVACFCLIASSMYVLNDLLDREADRRHPTKKTRPIAAGRISVGAAIIAGLVLFAAGGVSAAWLPNGFGLWVLAYVILNLIYSTSLKHHPPFDVMAIAVGFVFRVEAGSVLVVVSPTVWILSCTLLLALFLALAKRRDDLVLELDQAHRRSLAGYSKQFLDVSISVVLGALLVSYIIYTTDAAVMQRMGTDKLYLTLPFVLLGVLRYLQATLVFERSGSPTDVLLTDKVMLGTVIAWVIVFGILIYT